MMKSSFDRAKKFISSLLYTRGFWQLTLALFMLGMAIFFIRNQGIELLQIRKQLGESDPWYVGLGLLLTGLYIFLQAQMYVFSFKALGQQIPLLTSAKLYLKRNFVSVFLPAGGFTSLTFFTRDVEKEQVTKSQIHLASTIFGFASILSVIIIAAPVLAYALLLHDLRPAELLAFVFLIILTLGFLWFLYSVARKQIAYQWLIRIRPSLAMILDEMISHNIDRRQLYMTLLASMAIEVVGIVHLYVAMLALGYPPSWTASVMGYVVMVIILVASPFLRGLGAIEVSLTYVLGQFGFPVVAAVTITLLYRLFEFWLPLLAGVVSFFTKRENLLLRILPATVILVLGLINIISAITPAIPARLRLVRALFPEEAIATGNAIVLVFGLMLIILSVFLLQGSKRAWYMGLFLTGFSSIGHLLKAADYEEAIVAFLACAVLIYTRSSYRLRPHPRLTRVNSLAILYSLLAVLGYSIISFYFIDRRHFGIDFGFWTSVKIVFRMFFMLDSGLTPLTSFGRHFLNSIYFSAASVLCFVLFSLLKPYVTRPYNSDKDRNLVKEIVQRYGNSPLDFFKIYPDKFFFIANDRDGFISFKVTSHFAVVLENPVCKDEEAFMELVTDFDRFCDENGFVSVYYRVPQPSLDIYRKLKKKNMLVGEEAVVDLTTYTLEGGKMKTTRSAVNRLTGEGYIVKIYEPPIKEGLMQKLEHVSDNWLEALGQKEVAFTQGVFDSRILKEQTIITVENAEERVVAFLNLVPDYAPGEATYDLIRKGEEAPNGVFDMLLARTFLYLKEKGYKTVNMGLAPLSGIEGVNLAEKTIRYAYEKLKMFGHFKGLRKYKEKFYPRWEKKYLIYTNDFHLVQVPNALRRVSEGS
jgi:phosphatidylglycerol lysyltransferase